MESKSYLFALDYGNRKDEKEFVKAVLRRFDKNSLVGCGIFVSNNAYNFELYFFLYFEKSDTEFESWLSQNYPHKVRAYNIFVNELIDASFSRKSYSSVTFNEPEDVDLVFTSEVNDFFIFPDRSLIEDIWGPPVISKKKIFLSHSSKDKPIVDLYFNELQKTEIKVWYDREEIIPGDSITSKINEGLSECELGVLFMSDNFLSKHSGWTEAESNYFISARMKNTKSLIVVNLGVALDNIPPLLQDYLYIDAKSDKAVNELIRAVTKQLERT